MTSTTPLRAFYSVIQYVPDGSRAEAANAGVALYLPSRNRIEVRTSHSLDRVRQFFAPGHQHLQRILLGLESLKHRLMLAQAEFGNEADFAGFVAARADNVRLTAPRLVMVADPLTELDTLYEKLVGDRDSTRERASKVGFPPRLAEVVGRLQAEGKVWRPRSIVVPTIGRKFNVSIAYQNGVVNYVRAESLAKTRRLDPLLALLGFNGHLIGTHKIDDRNGKLIVLSAAPEADPATENRFARALSEFEVRFVSYDQTAAFAAEVEQTAH